MGGVGEIIFLVVVLGIVGIQQFLKNKKQKEQRETVKTEKGSGEVLQETWKSIFGGDDDPFDFGSNKEPAASKYVGQIDPRVSSDGKKYHHDGKFRGQPINNSKGKPVETGIVDDRFFEGPEDNSLIKDFDIRKAIIYTEIMTPKFKE